MIRTNGKYKNFKALTNTLDKKRFTTRDKLEIGLIVGTIVAVASLIVYNVLKYDIIVPVV